MTDHYTTLGLSPDADAAAIRKAYRSKAREAHPDAGGTKEAFHAVELAHRILSDADARAYYDATGSDDAPDLEANANGVIQQLVMEMLGKKGAKLIFLDINRELKDAISSALSQHKKAIKEGLNKQAQLERILTRIRSTDPEAKKANLLTVIFSDLLNQLKLNEEATEKQMEILLRALELCDTFSFEPEARPEPEVGFSRPSLGGLGGLGPSNPWT